MHVKQGYFFSCSKYIYSNAKESGIGMIFSLTMNVVLLRYQPFSSVRRYCCIASQAPLLWGWQFQANFSWLEAGRAFWSSYNINESISIGRINPYERQPLNSLPRWADYEYIIIMVYYFSGRTSRIQDASGFFFVHSWQVDKWIMTEKKIDKLT